MAVSFSVVEPQNSPYRVFVIGTLADDLREAGNGGFVFERAEFSPEIDPQSLFQRLIEAGPELILVADDALVPGVFPLLSRLRFTPQTGDRPIIIMTGQTPTSTMLECMERLEFSILSVSLPARQRCLNLAVRCRDARASRWRALREISGAMAHSLNQPISALLGSQEIIGRLGTTLPQQVCDALDLIHRNILEVEGIIRKLEEMRRYETVAYPGQGGGIIDLEKSTR